MLQAGQRFVEHQPSQSTLLKAIIIPFGVRLLAKLLSTTAKQEPTPPRNTQTCVNLCISRWITCTMVLFLLLTQLAKVLARLWARCAHTLRTQCVTLLINLTVVLKASTRCFHNLAATVALLSQCTLHKALMLTVA